MRRIAIGLASLALTGCSGAREPSVQPVAKATLAPGQTVEVVGLRRWTIRMIEDSLEKHVPGETLGSHACAANLRYKLGFADATVHTLVQAYIDGNDTTRTKSITLLVREPQDSGRVHPVRQAMGDSTPREEWRPVTDIFRSDLSGFGAFQQAWLAGFSPPRSAANFPGAEMYRVMESELTDSGYAKAIRVLRNSAGNADRSVAALILSRFPQRDGAWHALLTSAVEDRQWLDAEIARDALEAMSQRHPRPVDWQPVAPILRNVLDGTALPALVPLITVLRRTGVDQRSAVEFLGGGGEMLTALLEVSQTNVSDPAHDLLVALRGRDLGRSPGPWREWIATLQ
jgi:hypothetical protein